MKGKKILTVNEGYLEVEVDNLLSVDVADSLQDLLGEDAAGFLRENKLVLDNAVEQFPASDAATSRFTL